MNAEQIMARSPDREIMIMNEESNHIRRTVQCSGISVICSECSPSDQR